MWQQLLGQLMHQAYYTVCRPGRSLPYRMHSYEALRNLLRKASNAFKPQQLSPRAAKLIVQPQTMPKGSISVVLP